MSELDTHRLKQIERALGRTLTSDELTPVAGIDELTAEQVAVVKTLAPRQLLAALDYMRAVVPDALTGALKTFINQYA